MNAIFNRAAVGRMLTGAEAALDDCVDNLDEDDVVPLVLAVDFQRVVYHLCLAWHFKSLTEEELIRRPSEQYSALMDTLPNFGFKLTLLSGLDIETPFYVVRSSIEIFNTDVFHQELGLAAEVLENCKQKTLAGVYDDAPQATLAFDLQQVLAHLCLAWHLKNMAGDQIKQLTQEELCELQNTVPNFDFSMNLMPGLEP